MISRILVPMDDSKMAEKALEYALDNHPSAEVTVLHVVGVPSMLMGEAIGLTLEDDISETAAERAEPIFERAHKIADKRDQKIQTVIKMGHPVRNILNYAENYDTIVLGSHGEDRNRMAHRFLVGNIAETVSKRASVPVTIAR
jgi:nucleotide-binding universal stress UspA family protein